jgi:ribosomal-protein-alanine N-acetyltransferase
MIANRARVRISRFRVGDLPRVVQIERQCFGEFAWPSDLFRAYAEKCGAQFNTARLGRIVCGYSITCLIRGRAELVSIAVGRRYRRRGIGERLLSSTIRLLKRAGVSTLSLTVRRDNEPAIRLYRGLGFKRVRTIPGYYEDGATGWRMVATKLSG